MEMAYATVEVILVILDTILMAEIVYNIVELGVIPHRNLYHLVACGRVR